MQYPQSATNVQINDMYSYTQAGLPADKRLQANQLVAYNDINNHLQHQTVTANLDSTYTYNDEGQVTGMTYPSTIGVLNVVTAGASYNYSYDSMNRLGGMTSGSTTVVNGVSYDAANRLLGMTFNSLSESRSYNVLGQLTNINVQNLGYPYGTAENLTYNYPTGGTNNGKVSSMYNAVSGETVTYAYDSLNRMATAAGSGWGESYTLDPYGNLTTKQVTAGSGPSLSVSVNSSNQITSVYGQSYDANGNTRDGNLTAYDAENRLTGVGWNNTDAPAMFYAYDGQNKRIWSWTEVVDSLNNTTEYTVNMSSPSGQKLGAYLFVPGTYYSGGNYQPNITVSLVSSDQYFGGRRLAVMDQLGSSGGNNSTAGSFFPWGEPRGTNPQDTWSFATYWADSASGLDYANNRYYSNAYGRFITPDPYTSSAGLSNPQSWNRYGYTRGDPVNRFDPAGTDDCSVVFADASQPYDPNSPCSSPGASPSCPNSDMMMAFQSSPLAPTFYAEAAAMGCGLAFFQQGGGAVVPPLECGPAGYTTQPGQFFAPGTTTGGAYFGDPIELYFQATGGTGQYTFWATQTISWIGTVTYNNGGILTTVNLTGPVTLDGLLPGQLSGTSGANSVFFDFHDGPGIKTDTNMGTAVAFSATFYASATGWVSDGGDFVPCGTYNWRATFTWPLGGTPSGLATVTSVTEQ